MLLKQPFRIAGMTAASQRVQFRHSALPGRVQGFDSRSVMHHEIVIQQENTIQLRDFSTKLRQAVAI
jgi:hypothetical protein